MKQRKKWSKKAQSYNGMFSNMILMAIFLVVVSVAGLIAGIIYFDLNIMKTTLMTIDFPLPIENNATAILEYIHAD